MNKLKTYFVALAIGFAFSAQAMAAELSGADRREQARMGADYATTEEKIAADLKTAKAACLRLSGLSKENCLTAAAEDERAALADLNSKYQSSIDSGARTDDTSKAVAAKSETDPSRTAKRNDNGMQAVDTLFDFDSSDLRAAGRASLDDFIGKMKANSSAQISVVGYTDRIGSEDYNQRLSERRVESVKDYLVSEGIQANRINTEGKGQVQPVTKIDECGGGASAELIACLQPDRRVVVSMTAVTSSR